MNALKGLPYFTIVRVQGIVVRVYRYSTLLDSCTKTNEWAIRTETLIYLCYTAMLILTLHKILELYCLEKSMLMLNVLLNHDYSQQ